MARNDAERVWKLIESISFCMLSTWTGAQLRSRPMGAFVRAQEGIIYFLTDARTHKGEEIREFPKVCLAFADPRAKVRFNIRIGGNQVRSEKD